MTAQELKFDQRLGEDRIHLVEVVPSGDACERWSVPVNMVLNLCVPQNTGYFLTSWGTISFSIKTLFNGVSYFRREVLSFFIVTDEYANWQPLPKTVCFYEAVRKFLCFGWYSSLRLSWLNDTYPSELSSKKPARSWHAYSLEFVI